MVGLLIARRVAVVQKVKSEVDDELANAFLFYCRNNNF